MPPVPVDPARVHEFATPDAFYRWLSAHHASEPEAWINIHKKGSGLASITAKEAIDVVLCWGWIDGVRKGFERADDMPQAEKFSDLECDLAELANPA